MRDDQSSHALQPYLTNSHKSPRFKLSKDIISLVLVALCLGGIVILLIRGDIGHDGRQIAECIVRQNQEVSWHDLGFLTGGVIILTTVLGVPIVSATAFGGIVYLIVQLWQC